MIGWSFIALIVALALIGQISSPRSKDAPAHFAVYAGYLFISTLWAPVVFDIYSIVSDHALFDLGPYWLDPTSPAFYATWIALFFLEDFSFYWFHRTSHRLTLLWAAHVTHHSSRTFDLSVALRQSWTPFVAFPFWLPLLLLGFDPIAVMLMQFFSLFHQALLHTERVPHLGPLELLFNTPQHHRVHHGSNALYLDKNCGGVLILWDRLFGTYAELSEPIRYGIDREVPRNPLVIGIHGWLDLALTALRGRTR
jgi:sterol desaturase/sphingolipid hydroxylase (fatty acid hydroxylase superfamily)